MMATQHNAMAERNYALFLSTRAPLPLLVSDEAHYVQGGPAGRGILFVVKSKSSATVYRVTHLLADLGWVDLDLGCSTGRWAVLQLWCCPSKTVEHPKSRSKSTQPAGSPRGDGSPCKLLHSKAKLLFQCQQKVVLDQMDDLVLSCHWHLGSHYLETHCHLFAVDFGFNRYPKQ